MSSAETIHACPCGRESRFPASRAGEEETCPACGEAFRIPEGTAAQAEGPVVKIACARCGEWVAIDDAIEAGGGRVCAVCDADPASGRRLILGMRPWVLIAAIGSLALVALSAMDFGGEPETGAGPEVVAGAPESIGVEPAPEAAREAAREESVAPSAEPASALAAPAVRVPGRWAAQREGSLEKLGRVGLLCLTSGSASPPFDPQAGLASAEALLQLQADAFGAGDAGAARFLKPLAETLAARLSERGAEPIVLEVKPGGSIIESLGDEAGVDAYLIVVARLESSAYIQTLETKVKATVGFALYDGARAALLAGGGVDSEMVKLGNPASNSGAVRIGVDPVEYYAAGSRAAVEVVEEGLAPVLNGG